MAREDTYNFTYTDRKGKEWKAKVVIDINWLFRQVTARAAYNRTKRSVTMNGAIVTTVKEKTDDE